MLIMQQCKIYKWLVSLSSTRWNRILISRRVESKQASIFSRPNKHNIQKWCIKEEVPVIQKDRVRRRLRCDEHESDSDCSETLSRVPSTVWSWSSFLRHSSSSTHRATTSTDWLLATTMLLSYSTKSYVSFGWPRSSLTLARQTVYVMARRLAI